jgi:hypothetical protein
MMPREFVEAVKVAVQRGAETGLRTVLKQPPGRRPDPRLSALSSWYTALAPDDRAMVDAVLDLAAEQATYNFLLVLDGLIAVESFGGKGRLLLLHEGSGIRTLLNDPKGEQLTSIFKEEADKEA